ncbi:MAG: hypothetical protein QT00_C0001G0053 [archaeon GW2011_AR5]|nr:MAG: hypothetical protein QT00_C0001G0053 [archaeon GW2011_AR5]
MKLTNIDYKNPVSVYRHPNGIVERHYTDGRVEREFPNGIIEMRILIDGCIPYTTAIMPLKLGD